MDIWLHFSQDEVIRNIPYKIVCETKEGSRWETNRRRRAFSWSFSENEKKKVNDLCHKAHAWMLGKGVPADGVKMTVSTYELWMKLANFCASI